MIVLLFLYFRVTGKQTSSENMASSTTIIEEAAAEAGILQSKGSIKTTTHQRGRKRKAQEDDAQTCSVCQMMFVGQNC